MGSRLTEIKTKEFETAVRTLIAAETLGRPPHEETTKPVEQQSCEASMPPRPSVVESAVTSVEGHVGRLTSLAPPLHRHRSSRVGAPDSTPKIEGVHK